MSLEKIVWNDTETTGLDTEVSHILDLAWLREFEGVPCVHGPRRTLLQPVLHKEDKLYGHIPIEEFVEQYNSHFSNPQDPQRLAIFKFPDSDTGLFTYSEGSLTFNVEPPNVIDPGTWLTAPERIHPRHALDYLVEDLLDKSYRFGRWTLAGYNIEFDKKMLQTLFKRVYGVHRGLDLFGRVFNNYYTMDVMSLVRWHQYSGNLRMDRSKLVTAAAALGFSFGEDGAHTAAADMLMSRRVGHKLLKMDVKHENS